MRSVVKLANTVGIKACVEQQFEFAAQVLQEGLIPIVEPEIDINSPEKTAAENILKESLLAHLDSLAETQSVMLKLT